MQAIGSSEIVSHETYHVTCSNQSRRFVTDGLVEVNRSIDSHDTTIIVISFIDTDTNNTITTEAKQATFNSTHTKPLNDHYTVNLC